ncbi:flagellar assembly protein FliW [Uliginosibacterium sp. H3]|uniref:Flagellar assembly factor FliW n=1 Tax=Uliginosibacterium silvisoli TaxID=3114758 RepID=A0ABU6K861_9RHOO|nr:flagellar assembly protein FliW [Uliginosibacterium sp. H3]
MKIESPRFGSLDVDADKLIEFPGGLPGFEDCKKFTLLEMGEGESSGVGILQSVDRPEIAFSVAEPDQFGLHYEFSLTQDEEDLLRVSRIEDVAVFLILRRSDAGASEIPVKANLMAPLVINAAQRIGIQKVIARVGCDVTLKAA